MNSLIVSGNRQSKGQTMSPIELFWTAKKLTTKMKKYLSSFVLCVQTVRALGRPGSCVNILPDFKVSIPNVFVLSNVSDIIFWFINVEL